MPEASAIRVESEDEGWAYLRQALAGELPKDLVPVVAFKGWPHVEVYLPDTPIEGSISPQMMRALIELQDSIYRAHSAVTGGKPTARLSRAERERLEFRVEVKGGSSKYEIDLTKIFETLGTASIGKMTGTELIITILGLAVIFGSTAVLLSYLKGRATTKQEELRAKGQEQVLSAFQTLAAEDTKRMEVMANAMQRVPALRAAQEVADEARHELLKAIADESRAVVNGVEIDGEVANDLVKNVRRRSEDITVSGTYRVARVDTTVPDGFRVALRDVTSQEEITASLQDALISDEHRRKIREAEWAKKPVRVDLKARRRRNGIADAVVLDVQDVPPVRGVN